MMEQENFFIDYGLFKVSELCPSSNELGHVLARFSDSQKQKL